MKSSLTFGICLTDFEYGQWCDRCNLPSLVTARLLTYDLDTLVLGPGAGTFAKCTECDE